MAQLFWRLKKEDRLKRANPLKNTLLPFCFSRQSTPWRSCVFRQLFGESLQRFECLFQSAESGYLSVFITELKLHGKPLTPLVADRKKKGWHWMETLWIGNGIGFQPGHRHIKTLTYTLIRSSGTREFVLGVDLEAYVQDSVEKVEKCDDIFVDYKKAKKNCKTGGKCTAAPQFKVQLWWWDQWFYFWVRQLSHNTYVIWSTLCLIKAITM